MTTNGRRSASSDPLRLPGDRIFTGIILDSGHGGTFGVSPTDECPRMSWGRAVIQRCRGHQRRGEATAPGVVTRCGTAAGAAVVLLSDRVGDAREVTSTPPERGNHGKRPGQVRRVKSASTGSWCRRHRVHAAPPAAQGPDSPLRGSADRSSCAGTGTGTAPGTGPGTVPAPDSGCGFAMEGGSSGTV